MVAARNQSQHCCCLDRSCIAGCVCKEIKIRAQENVISSGLIWTVLLCQNRSNHLGEQWTMTVPNNRIFQLVFFYSLARVMTIHRMTSNKTNTNRQDALPCHVKREHLLSQIFEMQLNCKSNQNEAYASRQRCHSNFVNARKLTRLIVFFAMLDIFSIRLHIFAYIFSWYGKVNSSSQNLIFFEIWIEFIRQYSLTVF